MKPADKHTGHSSAATSKIEWTDSTWNPVTGCTWASTGCDNCYAVQMTRRLEAMGHEKYSGLTTKKHFSGVVKTHYDALTLPLSWRKPRRIFVNSMSDLFHKDVPDAFIDMVFAAMALCPQHTFQILTKRPARMADYFAGLQVAADNHVPNTANGSFTPTQVLNYRAACSSPLPFGVFGQAISTTEWPLPNVWIGTSCEDQQRADERIPWLLKCPAAVRFLSIEPLIGPIDLSRWLPPGGVHWRCSGCGSYVNASSSKWSNDCPSCGCVGYLSGSHEANGRKGRVIDWVIVGGESGPGARPMHPDWVRSIRDQCWDAAGVPFFFKQWGEWTTASQLSEEDYDAWSNSGNSMMQATDVARFGRKRAGRLLDGREWNEFPHSHRPSHGP